MSPGPKLPEEGWGPMAEVSEAARDEARDAVGEPLTDKGEGEDGELWPVRAGVGP